MWSRGSLAHSFVCTDGEETQTPHSGLFTTSGIKQFVTCLMRNELRQE
jgi:hypothetical protein